MQARWGTADSSSSFVSAPVDTSIPGYRQFARRTYRRSPRDLPSFVQSSSPRETIGAKAIAASTSPTRAGPRRALRYIRVVKQPATGTRRSARRRGIAAAVVVLLLIPAAASGDVLVNAIEPTTVSCGRSVTLGVWYQSFSGGPRWAHMTIKNSSGAVVWDKNVTAKTSWRYWHYKGRCGARYVVVYKTAAGTGRFPFRVKRG
jgi:hypothetical protein